MSGQIAELRLLLPRLGREYIEHEGVIGAAHARIWAEAQDCLASSTYEIRGVPHSVTVDWSAAATYVRVLHEDALGNTSTLASSLPPPTVPITISANPLRITPNAVARHFLSESFLILNLAAPGSCSFRRRTLLDKEGQSDEIFPQFGGVPFDEAWMASLDRGDIPVSEVSCARVAGWLRTRLSEPSHIARTSVERALFAVLHMALEDIVTPAQLIWASHALESLYRVPNALSYNLVRDRAPLLVDMPAETREAFARSLRKFYDARNAFAHGGMEIPHPLFDDALDRDLAEAHEALLERARFGLRLVVASLQAMCDRGFTELKFEEVMQPGDG